MYLISSIENFCEKKKRRKYDLSYRYYICIKSRKAEIALKIISASYDGIIINNIVTCTQQEKKEENDGDFSAGFDKLIQVFCRGGVVTNWVSPKCD